MGMKVFEGIFNFIGVEATVDTKIPSKIEGFVTV